MVEHKIRIYDWSNNQLNLYILSSNRTYPTWKLALISVYGQDNIFAADYYEILEENKLCRILRYRSLPKTDWNNLHFIVDVKSCSVEQAVGSTKIGAILLTHSE
jgi:hypothetical protein